VPLVPDDRRAALSGRRRAFLDAVRRCLLVFAFLPRLDIAVPRGAFLDAVGHCLLVFAFLPTLGVIPGWLFGEAYNPFIARDPIVMAFLPARGALALLHGFRDGIAARLAEGVLAGLPIAVLASRRGPATPAGRICFRAVCGALGAYAAGLVLAASRHTPDPDRIARELAGAIVCGIVAAPGAVRLVHAAPEGRAMPAAGQRGDTRPSASHQ
jgi:hypothetical protein